MKVTSGDILMKILTIGLLVFIVLVLSSSEAKAVEVEGYANFYAGNTETRGGNGVEFRSKEDKSIGLIGLSVPTPLSFSVGAEAFVTGSGLGGDVNISKKVSDFTFMLGRIAMRDRSYGRTKFGVAKSSIRGYGFITGVQYKMISLRYMEYEAGHTYTRWKTYYKHRHSSTTTDNVKRRELWLGVSFEF